MIWPASMNTTRLATSRANPISWVTTSMVMPSFARSTMVSSTSLTISGSSAEVGSSNSITFGFMVSARAIATRCCWPPDIWPGYFWACCGILTRSRYFMAIASASFCGMLRTQIGASVQFSRTVRCGNRLKLWNTMPTSRRTSSTRRRFGPSSMPSTTISPSWNSSSALMQRISVDLPEPDGPQITMRSPLPTVRSMSRSTWKSPYHLLRWEILTIESAMVIPSIAPMRVQPVLDKQRIARHAETEREVDDAGKGEARKQGCGRRPVRIRKRGAQNAQEVEQRHDRHQRGVFEQGDETVDEARNDVAEGLRQPDQEGGLGPGQDDGR